MDSLLDALGKGLRVLLNCAAVIGFVRRGLDSEGVHIQNANRRVELLKQAKNVAKEVRPLTPDEEDDVVRTILECAGVRGGVARAAGAVIKEVDCKSEGTAELPSGRPIAQLPEPSSAHVE
jgi:hypothetical protein